MTRPARAAAPACLFLFSLIALGLCLAPRTATALSDAETGCRQAIGKNVAKYSSSVYKTIERCHKKRSKGKLSQSVECNDVGQADPKNSLENRRAKLRDAITGSCSSAPTLLSTYARCPSPAQTTDDGGATDGIDSFAEVAECMIGLSEGLVSLGARESLGSPTGALSKEAGKCQKIIGARFRKLIATYSKERAACQAELDGSGGSSEYSCAGVDSRGKISNAASKLRSDVAKRCSLSDPWPLSKGNEALDAIQSCGDTVAQLQDCLTGSIGDRLGSGTIAMAYGLPSDCRAGSVIRSVNAGFGEQITLTSLGAGWNGLAHGIDFTDGFAEAIALDCDPDCANCQLSLDPSKGRPGLEVCRCVNDATIPCDTINGADADDCGLLNNQCQCFFGPPLAVNAAGVPACVPIAITGDYLGATDVGSGAWDNPLQVAAVIHLGEQLLQPCPACLGDPTPRDGLLEGTCQGGVRASLPCDSGGSHPTFGDVSIDCLPVSLKNISGAGLLLNFQLLSDDQEMPFNLPCDNPAESCACRVCSGDTSIGCRDDAECPTGTGTCTAGGGAGIQPNDCENHACTPEGQCATGPDNTYCDGITHPDGRGAVACNSPADCVAAGAGNCTVVERLRCYPDPIMVGGQPSFSGADMGGLACIGLTSSPAINVASGLPGPVRVALNVDTDVRCADDFDIPWDAPVGGNCPVSVTTTTLIGLPCGDTFPLCSGTCPGGQTCTNTGAACICQ